MKADCHIHMVLDGADWRGAIGRHRNGPDREWIRGRLREYAAAGFAYLRDGGDKWGVGAAAREMAGEWGITYRTPLAPLVFAGHYGGFIGEKYSDLREYAALVKQRREQGADFIKLMISGIAKFYKPEELIGKTLVAITNLPPRKMMGRESCGMLISAVHTENGEEKLNLLMVDDAIPAGAKLC